jgi:hypothetical protein
VLHAGPIKSPLDAVRGGSRGRHRQSMGISVYRTSDHTGVSAYGREITENANLRLEFDKIVCIGFGTKQSQYRVLIQPDSFKAVAEFMMKADPNEAIKAFGAALQIGIAQTSPKSN